MIYQEGVAPCFDCFKRCMLAHGLSFRGTSERGVVAIVVVIPVTELDGLHLWERMLCVTKPSAYIGVKAFFGP